jgi:hypothetical protein
MLRAHRLAAAALTAAAFSLAAPAAIAFADSAVPGVPADHPVTMQSDKDDKAPKLADTDKAPKLADSDKSAKVGDTDKAPKAADKDDKSAKVADKDDKSMDRDKFADRDTAKSTDKDKSASDKTAGDKSASDKSGSKSAAESGKDWAEPRPHGGVHTGGGFGALSGQTGMATGVVLLAGGLTVGALTLRNRKSSANRAA